MELNSELIAELKYCLFLKKRVIAKILLFVLSFGDLNCEAKLYVLFRSWKLRDQAYNENKVEIHLNGIFMDF